MQDLLTRFFSENADTALCIGLFPAADAYRALPRTLFPILKINAGFGILVMHVRAMDAGYLYYPSVASPCR